MYSSHGARPANYSQFDYFGEVGVMINAIAADSDIPVRNNLIIPSVSGTWSLESVWDTNIIPAYSNEIGALAVEQ